MLNPETYKYNLGEYIEFVGELDEDLLRRALADIVAHTAALRLVFDETDIEPVVILRPLVDFTVSQVDLRDDLLPGMTANRLMEDVLRRPRRTDANLFEFTLFRITADTTLLFTFYHHLLLDGYGMALTNQRIVERYIDLRDGEARNLEDDESLLADYLQTDSTYANSASWKDDRGFWLDLYSDVLSRRREYHSTARKTAGIARHTSLIGGSRLASLLTDSIPDLPTLFLALGTRLLDTGEEPVCVGFPFHGRVPYRFRRLAGMVTNVLPLRIATKSDALETRTNEIRRHLGEAVRHHRYRDLLADLRKAGASTELYRSNINIMRFGRPSGRPDLKVSIYALPCGEVPIQLSLKVCGNDEDVVELHFDTEAGASAVKNLEQWAMKFDALVDECIDRNGS